MKRKVLTVFLTIILIISALPLSTYAALPEGVPDTLEQPVLGDTEVKTLENGVPYFQIEIKIPKSVLDLEAAHPTDGFTWIEYYWKIDNGEWEKIDGGHIDSMIDAENMVPGKANTYYDNFNPIDEGSNDAIDIKNHTYVFKAKLYYQYYYGEGSGEWDYVPSQFSNEISIGSGSFYQKASEWSKTELQKASDLGLIPDILRGADMTKPITREEFCELSVLLYEKVTEKLSEPVSPNPFKDTTNPQILKAFKLGITTGTSVTTFSPKELINREQCAAMLLRAIKAIKPDGDFNIMGVKDFPDQKYISGWAVQAAKYMSKIGIITGDAKGNFMPKAATTVQEASGYGMATREQAIALTVRTFEKVPGIKSVSQASIPDKNEERLKALLTDRRISGSGGAGNNLPGLLLTVKDDGGLWGSGIMLPKEDTAKPGYCDNKGTQTPVKLSEDVVFTECAPGTLAAHAAYFYITSNGDLYSAGSDQFGRLGQGVEDGVWYKYFSPKVILKNVKFVDASESNALAITNKNELYIWGANFSDLQNERLVLNYNEDTCPAPLKIMDDVISAAIGVNGVMVVKKDGTLWSWGSNINGAILGDGFAQEKRKEPYKIMSNVKKVYANGNTAAAIKIDGSLWMWGDNFHGAVGAGYRQREGDYSDYVLKPVKVLDNVKTVAGMPSHTLALKNDGTAYVWGLNACGECGTAKGDYVLTPTKLANGVVDIAATKGESFILKSDGTIWGCGLNYDKYAFNGKGQENQKQLVNVGFGVK